MAKLIPAVKNLHEITNSGERDVAEALCQQLRHDVLILHSYPWLRMAEHPTTGASCLRPGEVDFVILDPRYGLLILEVKGSDVRYEPERRRWEQFDHLSETWHRVDPFEQAKKNKYALLDRLKEQGVFRGAPPFTVGHAVIFSQCRLQGALPANAHPSTCWDADALRDINRAVGRAFDSWCAIKHPKKLDPSLFRAMLDALKPAIRLVPVLWRDLDHQEEGLRRLTDEQKGVLRAIERIDRAMIEGVAGSGKTLLALAEAQRLARAGKRTLLVCFNNLLAAWLKANQPEELEQLLTISTFHQLCLDVSAQAGQPLDTAGRSQKFWSETLPERLLEAAPAVRDEHGFDAIIADEAQDFCDTWWIGLEALYRDPEGPKKLTVFYDPRQCIYNDAPVLPGGLVVPIMLATNCRNTRQIAEYCAKIGGFEPEIHDHAPDGVPPVVSTVATWKEVIERTKKVVQDWTLVDRGGLRPSQVAILIARRHENRWPEAFGNLPITRDLKAWRRDEGVLLATHRRFKGLEADAVVLAGVPEPGSRGYYAVEDHYVASSRAKHLLAVIHRPDPKKA